MTKSKPASAPGESWSQAEKRDLSVTMLRDHRLTSGEKVVGLTMLLYFHNSSSGDLFPSREQISKICSVSVDTAVRATKKLKAFLYLDYEETSGGRNERNSYAFRKQPHQKKVLGLETPAKSETRPPQNQKRKYP
jgi:hypothetical protein